MHNQFANPFYQSKLWRRTRADYLKACGGLCERCLARGLYRPATQVHHIQPLTPDNLSDPSVTVSWNNLEALCDDCHTRVHNPSVRWRIDSDGNVIL
jgi:5-methylcytosine-specific restriction endonuclease McrA